MASTDKDCNITKDFQFYFIGDKTIIKDEKMFNDFDVNYLNINNLPISYYPIYKSGKLLNDITDNFYAVRTEATQQEDKNKNTTIKNEFMKLKSNMENTKLSYNKYTIMPIVLMILIVWIFIFMFFLKYIHYHYNIYYIYFITAVIIGLLIFGSLWFLYVNSELI
jgi:hypothetical protein